MKHVIIIVILMASMDSVVAQNNSSFLPFILENKNNLKAFKNQYKRGDKIAKSEVDSLIAHADKALQSGLYSVTFHKAKLPPSGDMHDYVSQAPYWWPDSSKPDGKPYIRKDGRINPERNLATDYGQMKSLCSDVKDLALAYYFSDNVKYAKVAVQMMKVWFIDTATRMNPNLNFGQYIPGINDGRGIGIIETAGLTNIPDALAMMQESKQLNTAFINGIKQWFRQYTDWLLTSKNGKDERSQTNNHGTYYDLQLADFAFFTGDRLLAEKVIKEQTILRMDQQFTVDGAQPLELIRTKSWSYANMNLVGWCKLAVIADLLKIDLWNTHTTDGKGIQKALEWFMPYALKEKEWNHEQIEPITYSTVYALYHHTTVKYPGAGFNKVMEAYPEAKQQKPWW